MFNSLKEFGNNINTEKVMEKVGQIKEDVKDENSSISRGLEVAKDKLKENKQENLAGHIQQVQDSLRK